MTQSHIFLWFFVVQLPPDERRVHLPAGLGGTVVQRDVRSRFLRPRLPGALSVRERGVCDVATGGCQCAPGYTVRGEVRRRSFRILGFLFTSSGSNVMTYLWICLTCRHHQSQCLLCLCRGLTVNIFVKVAPTARTAPWSAPVKTLSTARQLTGLASAKKVKA